MKIGIITFHRALNCGAALQAWALKTFLERNGHEVGFIHNHVGKESRWYPVPKTSSVLRLMKGLALSAMKNICSFQCRDLAIERFGAFQRDFLPEVPMESCDIIVVGSDQVWRKSLTGDETNLFLGESISADIPLIAYAASFGDYDFAVSNAKSVSKSICRYCAVSVREQFAKDSLAELVKQDIAVVADPTLLLEHSDYASIAAKVDVDRPFLFAYAVHATQFFVETAKMMAKKLGLALVMTATCQHTRWGAPAGLTYGVSPDRMVGYIRDAQCVVASSFHGTAVSLLHGKPFVCLREDGPQATKSRPAAFLASVGELRRIVTPQTPVEDIVLALETPPSSDSVSKLAGLRAFSSKWLTDAISAAFPSDYRRGKD